MLEQILERFDDHGFIKLDGHDAAVRGVVENNEGLHLMYSLQAIYDELIKNSDMDYDDAREFYDFNILPLSMMENGPVFLEDT